MHEHRCPVWLSFTLTNIFRRLAHDPARILGPLVRPGDTVLDIGCGPGFFTIPLARLVGESGRVIAVDIQPGMIERTRREAEKAGLAARVRAVLADGTGLPPVEPADLALVFWMAHEVKDPEKLFEGIRAALKPEGRLLLVEPRLHVTEDRYGEILAAAERAGFETGETPAVRLSRAVVLRPAISRNRPTGDTAS
jgi:ubiquinone/menaquinone biosynthesis C-methylase UbiE